MDPLVVMSVFGTRPEVIKLAPVVARLETVGAFRAVNVASGQHTSLVEPFLEHFRVHVHHELRVMKAGQTPNDVCSRVLAALDPILVQERPSALLVQGDTTTALAAALAAFHRRIPVGHVEAGLRSGDPSIPFPEEMNRRLISKVATWHFAATEMNRRNLLGEGIGAERIFVTGNPVVDALNAVLADRAGGSSVDALVEATRGLRRIVLTTHRREAFGTTLTENLRVLRRFVDAHEDAALLFPVHPNPVVVETTQAALAGHPRIHLLEPQPYPDFVYLLSQAFLIVSDSGGVQEEAPSLGRPLLILRENTERPEALAHGLARLVGGSAGRLATMLEEAWRPGSWVQSTSSVANPFGQGDAAPRIVEALTGALLEPGSRGSLSGPEWTQESPARAATG